MICPLMSGPVIIEDEDGFYHPELVEIACRETACTLWKPLINGGCCNLNRFIEIRK